MIQNEILNVIDNITKSLQYKYILPLKEQVNYE